MSNSAPALISKACFRCRSDSPDARQPTLEYDLVAMGRHQRLSESVVRIVVGLLLAGVIGLFLVPRLLGWQLQVVLSGSMGGALPVGAVSFVQPVNPRELELGDLLVFQFPRDPSRQVTHRIVDIQGEGRTLEFRTKGDANNAADVDWVPAGKVRGTVRWYIPYLGYVVPYVRSPWGYVLFVIAPAIVIIIGETRRIVSALGSHGRGSTY
jgi:signal peptidase